ncbi:hypothetical protein HJC23_001525 [Cyclotella cryptica]|uniref:Uncharacterized protein n=1 Tax=Cyclotella cryptica TaxID=29204 RepID=A0ABD3PX47_9STRA
MAGPGVHSLLIIILSFLLHFPPSRLSRSHHSAVPMTQAFCHIALHYSTARLSWATIKSLHRNRSNKCDVKPAEYEILMGWTCLAFHSIYTSSGVEYAVRFVVPFYYYFKLLVIVVTFVVPALISLNPFHFWSGERGVSNPLVAAWFNCLIVPCVHRIHELMDHDPKKWVEEQLAILPLLFLDYFILPGILLTDEERETVRLSRSDHSWKATLKYDLLSEDLHNSPRMPPASLFQQDEFPVPVKNDQPSKVESKDYTIKTSPNSSFSQSYMQVGLDQPTVRQTENPLSPPHERRTTSIFNDGAPDNATSFFPRTTPTSGASKASANLCVASPVAKSRVVSSSLRLRRFSREHESCKSLTPRLHEPVSSDFITSEFVGAQKNGEGPNTCFNDEKESYKSSTVFLPSDVHDSPNIAAGTVKPIKRRRRERLSLGDHFRELVTGDANIRVRDHLFDLELPLVPCPSPRHRHGLNLDTSPSPPRTKTGKSNVCESQGEDFKATRAIDSSRIITRRSSRLAKTSTSCTEQC